MFTGIPGGSVSVAFRKNFPCLICFLLACVTVDFYNENINIARHSASHILAEAVKRLYPDAKLAIGPAIENGFYYDFDNVEIKQEDLRKIENVMKNILGQNKQVRSYVLSKAEAKEKM